MANSQQAKLLSKCATRHLIALSQAGDQAAKERLLEANLRLIHSITGRFCYAGREMDDLFQVGAIGLLKAIDKFDLRFDVAFSTYAVPLILGEIRRYLRDDNPISISRTLRERALLIKQKQAELSTLLGYQPQLKQLAESLNLSTEQVLAAADALKAPLSLEEPINKQADAPGLGEKLAAKHNPDQLLNSIVIKDLLAKLPARLAYILQSRYFEDKTQAQIAQKLNISQVQVSRLEKQALSQLRACPELRYDSLNIAEIF